MKLGVTEESDIVSVGERKKRNQENKIYEKLIVQVMNFVGNSFTN